MDFKEMYGKHKGATFIVMGLGVSLGTFIESGFVDVARSKGIVLIGVNDICRVVVPDYVLVADPPPKNIIKDERDVWNHILNCTCPNFITQRNEYACLGDNGTNMIWFKQGKLGLRNFGNTEGILDVSNTSPYIACLAAYYMGASKIGVIGVDITPNHCFINDGKYVLDNDDQLNMILRDFGNLHNTIKKKGCSVFNLSGVSKVTTLPKMTPEIFLGV